MKSFLQHSVMHAFVVLGLAAVFFGLSEYHSGNLARIMVFAVYAMGYNIMFGYTGLLSLGHALFFSAGMYGLSLSMHVLNIPAGYAIMLGILVSVVVSGVIGFLALRTRGVAFMIVTLMFAQAGYLAVLLAGKYTRGDEGIVIATATRTLGSIDLTQPENRYFAAWILFVIAYGFSAYLIQSSFGRTLIGIRENEERAQMLGYNVNRYKWIAVVISGTLSGIAGAAFALLWGYAGASFATVQYSIYPLLYVLLGGAGTLIGPLLGTAFMFYLIDYASEITQAYLLIVGIVLIGLTLFLPLGLAGEIRKRWLRWLP